jgi:hypothetical protein
VVLNEGGNVTGGTGGIANYRLPAIFGWRIAGPPYTLVIVGLLAATFALLWRLDHSWFGRACRAVRDNPEAAAAMGVDVARTKVIVFTLTSALAGIAGMVYAFVDNTVNPPIFGLDNAFLILFMVIVGGAGRHAGGGSARPCFSCCRSGSRDRRPSPPAHLRRAGGGGDPGSTQGIDRAVGSILEVRRLTKRFGGLTAVAGPRLQPGRRRDPRPDRPERRGQDHHLQHHRRHLRRRRRARSASAASRSSACRRTRSRAAG